MTAKAITSVQADDGSIPWEANRHADPWNHTEAAMGLGAAGEFEAARRAFDWLQATQAADGSWATSYRDGHVLDSASDANFCAYVAVGVHHHFLATGDRDFLQDLWPVVDSALEFALRLQLPTGEICWARDASGLTFPGALLTASACIHMSLSSGLALAVELGQERPNWGLARHRLGNAIRRRPQAFLRKDRYSMDWYYPVLGGAVTGAMAQARLESGWSSFVVDGFGVRCVSDRPWVTTAETCELVLTLRSIGLEREAANLFGWVQGLRTPSGAYWTGCTYPDGQTWPEEMPTWTAGVVLLATGPLAAPPSRMPSRSPACCTTPATTFSWSRPAA